MTSDPPIQTRQPKAIVIGGSLGGLFTGTMLRSIGWKVDVYERSTADLESRGGGIVLQPDVIQLLRRIGVKVNSLNLGVASRNRVVLNQDGSIQSDAPAPQMQTSWTLIYSTLREAFGDQHYHRGKRFLNAQQNGMGNGVTASFEDGTSESGDLLVGADGGSSTVRSAFWPEVAPTYAGYLAWRGLLAESQMTDVARKPLHGNFAFANAPHSHMLGYLVPGENNDVREGHRLYNWVWYRTASHGQLASLMTDRDGLERGFAMPEGYLTDAWQRHVNQEANVLLPRAFREVVHATEQPYAQAIRDLSVSTMVKDRVILLGDAAFIPRPHTAASTSKAAANAMALADVLAGVDDDGIDNALQGWNTSQLDLGRSLHVQGVRAGEQLMFRRRR